MALIDNQNLVARTYEVQAIAQQAIYQAEIAQKALAQQVRKDAQDAPGLVETMKESDGSQGLQLLSAEEKRRGRPARGKAAPKSGAENVPKEPQGKDLTPGPGHGHVDIRV